MEMPQINLVDFFKYFEGQPHQLEAIQLLQTSMNDSLLRNDSAWVEKFREEPKEPKAPITITPDLMHRLTGYSPESFDDLFCSDCNDLFSDTGFSGSLEAMQMLMANMMHETCNFVFMDEIADGWAYENRADLGNTEPGDGPRFKGAGVLMLTGRYNYSRLAQATGDMRVMEGCEYVTNNYPFTSAEIWIKDNDLYNVCLEQGFDACCYRINGGWNGYDDRRAKFEICKKEMV